MRHLGLSFIVAVLIIGCAGGTERAAIDELVRQARQAYVELDPHRALQLASEAADRDPSHPGAAIWRARLLAALGLFDDATLASEHAVQLAPDDPMAWGAYLYSYSSGGIYRGNRKWLERALEIGPEAIRKFPDHYPLYDDFDAAARDGLNRHEVYDSELEGLESDVGDSGIYQYVVVRDELEHADNDEESAQIKQRLNADLELLAQRAVAPIELDEAFKLAYGFNALDNREQSDRWLDVLENLPGGAPFAVRLRSYHLGMAQVEVWEDRARVLELLADQRKMREPSQLVDDSLFAMTGYLYTLQAELRHLSEALVDAQSLEAEAAEQYALRVAELGAVVGAALPGMGALAYRQAGNALVESGLQLVSAVSLADEALAALDSDRPGMLYPGEREEEAQRSRTSYRAAFHRIRGMARAGLGDSDEAETDVLSAAELDPSAENYRAIAEFRRSRDETEEAYDAYVSAFAWGFPAWQTDLVEGSRSAAVELAEAKGDTKAMFDADVERRKAEVEIARRETITSARLDQRASSFELVDLDGQTWRLDELRGRVVVLNFWATWCGPCRAEMPHYQKLVNEYSSVGDVAFLAISQDYETSDVVDYLIENSFRFPVALDDGVSNAFHVTGVPAHFMLDKSGKIQFATEGFIGGERYEREMNWRIEALRELR